MNRKKTIIPEKNYIWSNKEHISLNNNSPTNYDLNNSFFDPSNSSPPNDFMLKLNKRIEYYTSLGTNANNLDNT